MVLQNGRKTEVTFCDDLCLLCGQSYLKLDNLFKFAEQDTIELQLECFVTFFRQWLDLFQREGHVVLGDLGFVNNPDIGQ